MYSLDRSRVFPRLHTLSCLHVPQFYRVVCRTCRQEFVVRRNIDRPDGALVARIRSESLAVAGEPCTNNFVFGHREEKIAMSVVFDLVQGPLVALEENRSHCVNTLSILCGKKSAKGRGHSN